jgi:hypothetical protein
MYGMLLVGIPKVLWYGSEGQFNFLVMQLLGPSLEDLFCLCERRFTIKTTILIAIQLVYIIVDCSRTIHTWQRNHTPRY